MKSACDVLSSYILRSITLSWLNIWWVVKHTKPHENIKISIRSKYDCQKYQSRVKHIKKLPALRILGNVTPCILPTAIWKAMGSHSCKVQSYFSVGPVNICHNFSTDIFKLTSLWNVVGSRHAHSSYTPGNIRVLTKHPANRIHSVDQISVAFEQCRAKIYSANVFRSC